MALTLAEIRCGRPWTAVEQQLAEAVTTRLTAQSLTRVEPSLYDGLAGDVTALRVLSPGAETTAPQRLSDLATPAGWTTA